MSDTLLNLPSAQTGDVNAERVAGRDVTHIEGVDPAPVIELLGKRIELQLADLVKVTANSVTAIALLIFAQVLALALWGTTIFFLVQPHLVAGR